MATMIALPISIALVWAAPSVTLPDEVPGLRGQVTDSAGAPLPGASVVVLGPDPDEVAAAMIGNLSAQREPDPWIAYLFLASHEVVVRPDREIHTVAKDGRFAVPLVPDRVYRVRVEHPGYATALYRVVPRAGAIDLDVQLHRAAPLCVAVVDSTGEPLPASIEAMRCHEESCDGVLSGAVDLEVDADTSCTDQLVPGKHRLAVFAEGRPFKMVDVVVPDPAVRIVLD